MTVPPSAESVTRQVYMGLSDLEKDIWSGLSYLAILPFAIGVCRLVQRFRQGQGQSRLDHGLRHIGSKLLVILGHSWIGRDNWAVGLAPLGIFYGFIALFIGTSILFVQVDIVGPLLQIAFWQGGFNLVYSFVLDEMGLLTLAGALYMALRRGLLQPWRLSYARVDGRAETPRRRRFQLGDWGFLGLLLFILLSGFVLESLRIVATGTSVEGFWSPVGASLAQGLMAAGVTGTAESVMYHQLWWVHGIAALTFVVLILFTKAMHMMVSPAAMLTEVSAAARALPTAPAFELEHDEADADEEQRVGYGALADFSPKHLMDLDACTKCGRCHEVCPARTTGYPLSPRDMILDLQELSANGDRGNGGLIPPETLWSCTTCMACMDICPVGIEHLPIIVEMRRSLVEEGEMDANLQSTMETISKSGNSFGLSKRKRAVWTKGLTVEIKDIRKTPAEILWFVGDFASFDARNQKVTRQIARTLSECGVDYGILYEGETTAGNDVRRSGEEGLRLFQAEKNIASIEKYEFQRILTSDPHSYNTLKNEYTEEGASWTPNQVIHHKELLLEFARAGRLPIKNRLNRRVTYHDPGYLGRYNGVFDPPRELLAHIGVTLVEMPRSRKNSFCCGAGGGRIWMNEKDREGKERLGENRISEAVALPDVSSYIVACPKCEIMFEDAIKSSGNSSAITLNDITELLAEAMGLNRPD